MPPKRIYIFTYPRTASSLLIKVLNLPDQPGVVSTGNGGYFFLPAIQRLRQLRLLEKRQDQWEEAETDELQTEYRRCLDHLKQFVTLATEKTVVIKEHVPHMIDPVVKAGYLRERRGNAKLAVNNTVVPDEFLLGWTPTFLIRHPALAFPSYYRILRRNVLERGEDLVTIEGELAAGMTLRWTRQLYDWYCSKLPQSNPIVLDASDILANPRILMRLCDLVGLQAEKMRFQWEPASAEELRETDPITVQMNTTLLSSGGIIEDRIVNPDCLDIKREMEGWKTEFGVSEGERIAVWVMDSLEDYEYLRKKRPAE
ncbi:hypothetical protein BDW72DRAFT_214571 [Aspergillus terricola var. indicus]